MCRSLGDKCERETFIVWGIHRIMYVYIDVSFNINRDFYYLGVVFGIMLYIYMYPSILKEAFIIWGIQGIMYIPIYNVSFNIKRGFYYLGGSFWHYVHMYQY